MCGDEAPPISIVSALMVLLALRLDGSISRLILRSVRLWDKHTEQRIRKTNSGNGPIVEGSWYSSNYKRSCVRFRYSCIHCQHWFSCEDLVDLDDSRQLFLSWELPVHLSSWDFSLGVSEMHMWVLLIGSVQCTFYNLSYMYLMILMNLFGNDQCTLGSIKKLNLLRKTALHQT